MTDTRANTDKVLDLLSHPDVEVQKQGRELFLTLFEAEDPAVLELLDRSYLQEDGRLTDTLPWSDTLLEVFFGDSRIQIHPEGKASSGDVYALDLSPLACEEGRFQTLSWLQYLPNLKRLDIPCQVLTDEMVDNLATLKNLEWLNTFGCASPWASMEKLSTLAKGYDGRVLPPGVARFFQCNTNDPDEIHVRAYRIGSVALHIVKKGQLQRIYFLAEGYGGGGDQYENEVRLDFNSDGTIEANKSWGYGGETYDHTVQVFPEEMDGDEREMPELDRAIFDELYEYLDTYRYYDDEEWSANRPKPELLEKLNGGIFCEGYVDTTLMFGLARPVLGFNTYWLTPDDVESLLRSIPTPPSRWKAYEDAPSRIQFLIDPFIDSVIDEELYEREVPLEKGTPDYVAAVEAIMEKTQEKIGRMTDQLGWTFSRKVVMKDEYYTLYLIYESDGGIYNYDGQLLKISGEEELYFCAADLTSEITQSYCCGDYDTGGISCPENSDAYREHARRLKARLENEG